MSNLTIRLRLNEESNLGPLLEGVPAVQTKLIDNGDGTYGLDGIVHRPTAEQMGVIDHVTQTRADLKAEIARLAEALWECMKHAGADTSYADSADHAYRLGHLPESTVEAVKELRQDYIEAGGG